VKIRVHPWQKKHIHSWFKTSASIRGTTNTPASSSPMLVFSLKIITLQSQSFVTPRIHFAHATLPLLLVTCLLGLHHGSTDHQTVPQRHHRPGVPVIPMKSPESHENSTHFPEDSSRPFVELLRSIP
jgi:hypothetical protein